MADSELHNLLPFAEILDNIDVGIALFDPQGNYLFVNTNLINWRNIPRAEFLSHNVHDFLKIMDVCVFDLVMEKKQLVKRLQTYRNFHNMDGVTRLRMVTGIPIFDAFGNIQYVISMMQDIQTFEDLYHSLLKEHKIINYDTKEPAVREKQDIVAKSPAFQQLLSIAANVASLDSTVLLYGESGSGKEVLAHYIYEHSERCGKPLITVNCAAFPENLIEAELFGYEKGSFTGAAKDGKIGLVEAADGGTLFLDEINSLPINVQGKLLRTLEEKSIQRIGSTKTKKVNFRLIAATNRNLQKLVEQGQFREDLYYRIQVIPLTIPPLHNRKEDIIPLCLHFLHYFGKKYNLQKEFSDSVLDAVQRYSWPGNVRELRNFVERMVVMTPRATRMISQIPDGLLDITPDKRHDSGKDIPGTKSTVSAIFPSGPIPQASLPISFSGSITNHFPGDVTVPATISGVRRSNMPTRDQIIAALQTCSGHREKTAEYLGISRRCLQYKIKEYHISPRCHYDDK